MAYYMGDYYQGDPFIGPLVGALAKRALPGLARKAVGAVGRIISRPSVARTIGGAAAGAAATAVMRRPAIAPSMVPLQTPNLPGFPIGGTRIIPQNIVPGGRPFTVSEQAPRGYHLNKNVARGRTGPCDYKNYWVKNRRMNVANPRALRRAIVRATGFAKLARRVLSFTQARAPRGKAVFRRKRRR